MYRQILSKPSSLVHRSWNRSFNAAATSRQKRALNNDQLGDKPAAGATAPTPEAVAAAADKGGGGSMFPLLGLFAVAGGVGAAYSMDLIPQDWIPAGIPGVSPSPSPVVSSKKDDAAATTKDDPKNKEETSAPSESGSSSSRSSGNRVLNISLPEGSKQSAPPTVATDHPVGGNRVAMSPGSGLEHAAAKEPGPSPEQALKELQAKLAQETDSVLEDAHKELAKLSNLNMGELDHLTASQLKIRLVQMAKDLEDRTKWEAVRLKEFLAMKEKEVENKYLLILKKQRLEAESLLVQRLHDQRSDLERQATKALKQKEDELQSVVDSSLKLQEQQYNDEKAGFEKQTEEKMSAKFEELFGKSLAKAKQEMADRMEQKARQMEALTAKLKDLEFALKSSQDYQSGSVRAHRMSAAAIALIDKLESSEPAGALIDALKSVAQNNSVVTSALDALPPNVASSGAATLQELQTRFEDSVLAKCRQAANVPTGQQGLEGQLLGVIFATLKYPPGPDDVAPESEKNASEYVLARARRYVQLGDLEQAVEQMSKLEGQAAFTANDWVQSAKERVAVEKALKVIRMECALANESMGKTG